MGRNVESALEFILQRKPGSTNPLDSGMEALEKIENFRWQQNFFLAAEVLNSPLLLHPSADLFSARPPGPISFHHTPLLALGHLPAFRQDSSVTQLLPCATLSRAESLSAVSRNQ